MERRQRLGQESAARKALIASSYHPARPEIYNSLQVPGRGRLLGGGGVQAGWLPAPQWVCIFCPQDVALAPEFLATAEYSTLPGADLQGLLQRLETVSGEVLAHDLGGLGGGRRESLYPLCVPPKTNPAGAGRYRSRALIRTHSLAQDTVIQCLVSCMSQLG